MKVLSEEEERKHYNAVLKTGLTWGGAGLAIGTAGAAVLNARWRPFQSLTLPLKAFAVTSVTTFALIVGADRGSKHFEEEAHRSSHIGEEQESLEQQIGIGQRRRDTSHLTTGGRIIKHLNDNKYSYVFGGWATSLLGSFAYISYSPLTTAQKVVQARMYAQSLTVVMLLASAGLATSTSGQEVEEEERRRENTTYRFKKNSPHEKEERERREKQRQQAAEELEHEEGSGNA